MIMIVFFHGFWEKSDNINEEASSSLVEILWSGSDGIRAASERLTVPDSLLN